MENTKYFFFATRQVAKSACLVSIINLHESVSHETVWDEWHLHRWGAEGKIVIWSTGQTVWVFYFMRTPVLGSYFGVTPEWALWYHTVREANRTLFLFTYKTLDVIYWGITALTPSVARDFMILLFLFFFLSLSRSLSLSFISFLFLNHFKHCHCHSL